MVRIHISQQPFTQMMLLQLPIKEALRLLLNIMERRCIFSPNFSPTCQLRSNADTMLHLILWSKSSFSRRPRGIILQYLLWSSDSRWHAHACFSKKPSCVSFIKINIMQMSFNNYLDGDAAYSAACDFAEPTCVIVKHTNPCGVATRQDLKEAYQLAVQADPTSAFGGIVAFNRLITFHKSQNDARCFTVIE